MALARPGVVNVRTAGAHHAVLDVAAGLRARLLAGTGANLLGQVLTAAIQILSLPLFLHFWSTAQYGKWVMLSAVPAYFSMSDGGVIPVAANRITMLRAAGSPDHADRVFQSALALVVAAIAGIATTSALVLLAMGDGLIDGQSRMALWLLILATLVSLFGGLFEAGFRAFGRYAQGVLWGNGVRLLEFLGLVAGLALGSTFTSAALGALAGRTLGSLVLARHCQHLFPELRWRLDGASGHELRSLLRPAIAYMAFPLGNALSLQALTLLVGGVLGTVAVAIFNTYRTLSRVALQMTSTFSLALWSEFSRLYGARQRLTLEQVFVNGIAWGGGISLALSVAMLLAAPALLQWWTHGKIAFDAHLFLWFAAATLVGGLWHVPRVLLLSTNCHARLGVLFLAVSVLGVMVAAGAIGFMGATGAVLSMLLSESVMAGASIALALGVIRALRAEGNAP